VKYKALVLLTKKVTFVSTLPQKVCIDFHFGLVHTQVHGGKQMMTEFNSRNDIIQLSMQSKAQITERERHTHTHTRTDIGEASNASSWQG